MTIAWFHCFSGIAGDMALGALVDAGVDLDEITAMCRKLPVRGWRLDAEPVLRCGIAATKIHVRTEETSVVRTYSHIAGMIEEARLPDRVRQRALATFHALAVVEGDLHRRPPEQVHFHEVGALDAIIDIIGVAAGLEVLEVDEIHASPVANGMGMVRAAHGSLPNPAPAVVALLRGAPTYGLDIPFELTTPTGAALLAANATRFGPMPAMEVSSVGYGAGSRELDGRPNTVQVVIGAAVPASAGAGGLTGQVPGQPVMVLEVNVDDATGETLAHAIAALLDAGAHDAWVTPILMKKGRPAHTVAALVDPALAGQVGEVLQRETGSLGLRGTTLDRWPSTRSVEEVDVDGLPIRIKVSPGRVKVEHDDAARVAKRTGRPLREVVSRAEEMARRPHEHAPAPDDETPA